MHRIPRWFLAWSACLPLLAACRTAGEPALTAIPEDHLALEVGCGSASLLSGDRIRLAPALDRAALRVRLVRLDASQAGWMLQEGWHREPADGTAVETGIPSAAARATLRIPEPPCAAEPAMPPMYVGLGLAPGTESRPVTRASVSVATASTSARRVRLDESRPGAFLAARAEESGATLLSIDSEPEAAVELEALALPLGRAPIELDKEYRDSIVGSSVRSAAFRLVPPESASVRFAVAAASQVFSTTEASSPAGEGSWSFRITVEDRGGRTEVFREQIPSEEAPPGMWHDREASLAAFAGREITLTLSVVPAGKPAALALWGSPQIVASAPGPSPRPNILLVSIDTLRADRIGRVTAGQPVTPVLDRLAARGVSFTQCRTQAPSTLYGHATMLTGLPPSAHGATTTSALSTGVPYLPDLLAGAGYATVAITDDGLLDGRFGFSRGFDLFRNRYEPIEQKADAAIRALDRLDAPWFVFLHTYEIHTPYDPPEELARRLAPDYEGPLAGKTDAVNVMRGISWINKNKLDMTDADLEYLEALYDAEIQRTDAALGRIFEAMRRGDRWDDTIVVVTSDHGDEFDEHGVVAWHSLTCYDEVMRVPLIIKPARSGASGRTTGTAVASQDIAPTILDLAGLPVPDVLWGRSLAGLVAGEDEPDREALCEIEDGRGAALLVDGWKVHTRTPESVADPAVFARRLSTRGRYGELELYDLSADPGEQNDLAPDDPERARALAELLARRLETARALFASLTEGQPPPERPRVDDEHMRRLRALGYVQ